MPYFILFFVFSVLNFSLFGWVYQILVGVFACDWLNSMCWLSYFGVIGLVIWFLNSVELYMTFSYLARGACLWRPVSLAFPCILLNGINGAGFYVLY